MHIYGALVYLKICAVISSDSTYSADSDVAILNTNRSCYLLNYLPYMSMKTWLFKMLSFYLFFLLIFLLLFDCLGCSPGKAFCL